jgi:iron(III) transport system ATP-binding protein
MVFQSYAIWPHMTVFENAAFPLQVGDRKYSRTQVRENVMRVLTAVQLDELADREATKLSGGQQQRLALARALVMEPALLLLDEPLSNLDAKLRERMRFELKRLQRDLKITTVYVTHDQSEALALSHEIAVMNQGRILQVGRPRDIYEHPANQFVADFVGNTNFLHANVVCHNGSGGYVVRTEIGDVHVSSTREMSAGDHISVSIRPEDLELTEAPQSRENVWQGTVEQKVFLGEAIDFRVLVGSRSLLSRQHPTLRTPVGGAIFVHVNPEKCVVFSTT